MVTIFTPIFNRAYAIKQLYQSLLRQTSYDFEWLIVDDGSTDNIASVIQEWKEEKEAPFKIRFYRQENGGKHRAINYGVKLADGEAFFIVDSDDYLTDDAVSLIDQWWEDVAGDDSFAGVSGLKKQKENGIAGDFLPLEDFVDATNLERKKYGLLGDKAEVYKTSVLRKYPFPEYEGENFLTEAVVWDRIAYDGLKIRWYNQAIYICEYRNDGLTKQGRALFVKNPIGWAAYIKQTCRVFHSNRQEKLYRYLSYCLELKNLIGRDDIQKNLEINEEVYAEIWDCYDKCIEKTAEKIGTRIALYGTGVRGKKIWKMYQQTSIEIIFVMDRNHTDLPVIQLPIDAQLPEVDVIIITPKNESEEIAKQLRKNTKSKLIKYGEWLDCLGLPWDY